MERFIEWLLGDNPMGVVMRSPNVFAAAMLLGLLGGWWTNNLVRGPRIEELEDRNSELTERLNLKTPEINFYSHLTNAELIRESREVIQNIRRLIYMYNTEHASVSGIGMADRIAAKGNPARQDQIWADATARDRENEAIETSQYGNCCEVSVGQLYDQLTQRLTASTIQRIQAQYPISFGLPLADNDELENIAGNLEMLADSLPAHDFSTAVSRYWADLRVEVVALLAFISGLFIGLWLRREIKRNRNTGSSIIVVPN